MGSKVLLVGSAVWLLWAPPCARPGETPAQADLAERIHRAIAAKMPREYEDRSEWGATIPLPPTFRFPRLRRTFVKVGDHYELPDGTWRRTRVWVNDPDRDLRIRVPQVRKAGKHRTRLLVEATLAVQGQRQRLEWVRGVRLLDVTAEADAVVTVGLDVDVTVAFDPARPLDGLKVEVQVVRARVQLKEFHLRRVGPVVFQEQGPLGEELKAALQERLKALEPRVRDYANRALLESLKGGRGLHE